MRFDPAVVEKFQAGGEFEGEGIRVVNSRSAAEAVVQELINADCPAGVDTEYDTDCQIQCWSVAYKDNDKIVIAGEFLDAFKPWLESSSAPKVFWNFAADEEVLEKAGIHVRGFHADVMVMDFLLDTGDREHNLKHASEKWLDQKMMGGFKDVFSYVPDGKVKPVMFRWHEIWAHHQEALIIYSADDPLKTLLLYKHHRKELEARKYWPTYQSEDRWFTLTLIDVMKRGMLIDTKRLQSILTSVILQGLRKEHLIRAFSKKPDLNIKSVQQLKALFFDELGMPGVKQTKGEEMNRSTAATCMDAEVLEVWSEDYVNGYPEGAQIAELLLDARRLNTLKGTFLQGILLGVEPSTGRLYSDLNQIGAVTGRISSRKYVDETEEIYETAKGEERSRIVKVRRGANLQNMPAKKDKDPYGIRGAFIAPPGHRLVVVDMAGFEWWLMGHVSDDPVIAKQNLRGQKHGFDKVDPHAETAKHLFDLKCELTEVKAQYPAERSKGKNANFGLIYGCQAAKACKITGITDDENEMQDYINKFFDLYAGIIEYHARIISFARQHGYVETISTRRVQMDEIDSRDKSKRAHTENAAKNAPVQGTAADIIKASMNLFENGMRWYKRHPVSGDNAKCLKVKEAAERADHMRKKFDAKMLLQVHDEIIWEVPEEHADECVEHAVFLMTHHRWSPQMKIMTPAEGKHGASWLEAK